VAAKRVEYLKELLSQADLDPSRLEMFNLSAAEGPRWGQICNEFTERIRGLGPSPVHTALREAGRLTESSDRLSELREPTPEAEEQESESQEQMSEAGSRESDN